MFALNALCWQYDDKVISISKWEMTHTQISALLLYIVWNYLLFIPFFGESSTLGMQSQCHIQSSAELYLAAIYRYFHCNMFVFADLVMVATKFWLHYCLERGRHFCLIRICLLIKRALRVQVRFNHAGSDFKPFYFIWCFPFYQTRWIARVSAIQPLN